jgi:hypothetical protein
MNIVPSRLANATTASLAPVEQANSSAPVKRSSRRSKEASPSAQPISAPL